MDIRKVLMSIRRVWYKMNGNNYIKDNLFFAEEITFDFPGEEISQNEIDEIDNFPGKEDFVHFYHVHNGGDFIDGARFYPEDCYKVSLGKASYIAVSVFLSISLNDVQGGNIESTKDMILLAHENYEDFMLFHIPFALDAVSNPFWIDIQTGEIKYTDYEVCLNPDEDAIVVASSFKDFCKCIRKNQFRN